MLLETWEKLGEGERNILMTFLMRLYAGQRKFGPLTRDKKDWKYESIEEALDLAVYLSCALESKAHKAFHSAVEDAIAEVTVVPDDCVPEWIKEHLRLNGA